MFHTFSQSRTACLGAGLIAGVILGMILGGIWPDAPLHAVSTDRSKTFVMASGPVDEEFEAVYFLDFLTGDLTAVVLGRQGNAFTARYHRNIIQDLGVNPAKNPSYMMVTGTTLVQRGMAQVRPSLGSVFVAEIGSGRVAAYSIPWSKNAHRTGRPIQGTLVPLAVTEFRAAAGGGTAPPPLPVPR